MQPETCEVRPAYAEPTDRPSGNRPSSARSVNPSREFSSDDRNGSSASKYRVLIVGRDKMSADLLASTLNRSSSCEAASVSAERLGSSLSEGRTHIAVISDELGERKSSFQLISSVLQNHPDLMVVILLGKPSHASVVNAFRAGARGVFSRERPLKEFLDCLEHVRRGYLWAGPYEADVLLHVLRQLPAPSITMAANTTPLTEREMQVVQCAATGKTNRQIAQELRLSENTVKNYLFKVFEKLGVSSRVELLFCLALRGHTFGERSNDPAETNTEEDV